MTAALNIKGLRGGYGKLEVFRDVSLQLQPGSTIGLLGPNGTGKSTLVKTIAGLLPAQGGIVDYFGVDVSGEPAYRRARQGLALVPEGRQIFGSLSVEDNLLLARNAQGKDRSHNSFSERLADVYALFPRLKERRAQMGGSLSGGEQQMLAVGRALMMDPRVLMLDEPTQGLAPIVIEEMIGALKTLKGRFSMLIIEQNRFFLEHLSDQILYMEHGAVTERPENAQVKDRG